MVGTQTVLNDLPSLNVRDCVHPINRQPIKLIVDPAGKVWHPPKEKRRALAEKLFVEGSKSVVFIKESVSESGSPFENLDRVCCIKLSESKFFQDMVIQLESETIKSFAGQTLQSILVEGGPRLITMLDELKMIDVYHTFIGSCFLGGEKNRIYRDLKSPIADKRSLKLMASFSLENDVVMEMIPVDHHQTLFSNLD